MPSPFGSVTKRKIANMVTHRPRSRPRKRPSPAGHRERWEAPYGRGPDRPPRRKVAYAPDRGPPLRDAVAQRRSSATPRQVHTQKDYGAAHDLVRPEALAQEDDARGDAGEGDEVLVHQHPVGPDAAY